MLPRIHHRDRQELAYFNPMDAFEFLVRRKDQGLEMDAAVIATKVVR
jgi:hypothetical protein